MPNLPALTDAILQWLNREGASLNTLAGSVVVLDQLIRKVPLTENDVFTDGGQLIGGRGRALKGTLQKHGISPTFLSDGVTTRSTNKFRSLLQAIDNGQTLAPMSPDERANIVRALIEPIAALISEKASRPPLEVDFSSRRSLATQVKEILHEGRQRSRGRIEQHLVGAKLECRFPDLGINRLRAYAADVQTERTGDFVIRQTVYHVTASPVELLIEKVKMNLAGGLQPVLIIPQDRVVRAKTLAIEGSVFDQIIILSLEDFLTQNILEMADHQGVTHDQMLENVLKRYNQRIEDVETDQSLRIVLKQSNSNDLSKNVPGNPSD